MSWQQNVALQVAFGQDERTAASQKDTTADSSILRYIKTLTKHQMNAKQQRMDRYLQHVKHSQSAEDFSVRLSKPPQCPSVIQNQRQHLQKKSKSKAKPRRKNRARADRNDQEQVAAATESRSRLQRPHHASHENRRLKKPKRTQQTIAIGSLDRFRLQSASSQKSATSLREEYPGNKTSQDVTALVENKLAQPVQMRGLTRMPQSASSGFSTMSTALERRPVQVWLHVSQKLAEYQP